jgi:hypothetical protein
MEQIPNSVDGRVSIIVSGVVGFAAEDIKASLRTWKTPDNARRNEK